MHAPHFVLFGLALLMLTTAPAIAEPTHSGVIEFDAQKPLAKAAVAKANKTSVRHHKANTVTGKTTGKETPRQQPLTTLDLDTLTERLRETDALGFFTKLELKSQMDDLVGDFKQYHDHRKYDPLKLEQLRERFNLLLLKVMTLVQNEDPKLSADIAFAEPQLWDVLNNPQELAKL